MQEQKQRLRLSASLAGCALFGGLVAVAAHGADEPAEAELPTKPNVVIILADDLGWGDVGANNPDSGLSTPHIDGMAAEGMRFSDAHSPAPLCTPTRYGLLTGRYAWRTSLEGGNLGMFAPALIAADRPTLGTLLKAHGYRTAAVGKWHLGMDYGRVPEEDVTSINMGIDFAAEIADSPVDRGFDEFFGLSAGLSWSPYVYIRDDRFTAVPTRLRSFGENGRRTPALPVADGFDRYEVLDDFAEEAIAFIDRSSRTADPFFLYLALNAPHGPFVVADRFAGTTGMGPYGDYVAQMDWVVGQVLDALDERGVGENTLVVFTSDNGSVMEAYYSRRDHTTRPWVLGYHPDRHRSNGRWRGKKGWIYEGGHRVPFVVRWPAVVGAGAESAATVSQIDLFATLAELMDQELGMEEAPDSVSLLPVLRGDSWERGFPIVHRTGSGTYAIRGGRWKLILGNGHGGGGRGSGEAWALPYQLYDLSANPAESDNVLDAHPAVSSELRGAFEEIRSTERALGRLRDAYLTTLTLTSVDMGVFSAGVTAYAAEVPGEVTTTSVLAKKRHAGAEIAITPADADADADGHQVALAVGANEIAVTVTAADTATMRTYTVAVTRAATPVASFSLSAAPAEIEEGENSALTLAITNGVTFAEDQTLAMQVSGVSASDYSLVPETLTLPAGSSSASATLSAVLDDLEEVAETAQITALLSGSAVGSASVVISDPASQPVPGIAGVPQVGGSLEATFEEPAPAEIRYQWLRGASGDEIAGAVGASYTPVEADEDQALSVRVDLGNLAVAHTSAATAPVWPAASNPPLAPGENELLRATMTLGSSDAFPFWLAGYGRFGGVAFGSMDRLSFSVGDVEHELTAAMVNPPGGFALQASPRIADVSGLVVYWNDYRIESLAPDNASDPEFWVSSTPQPKSEYGRYWRGASDGVQVALSIRRLGPEDDAGLSALTLSDVDIGAFDSEVTSYAAEVAFDVEMTTLEAVASDDRAVVEIADSVGSTVGPRRTSRLAGGANEITVTVTAADKETTRTYAVTVTRTVPRWGSRRPSRDISLPGADTATGMWSDGSTMWVVADRWEGVVQGYSLEDGSRLPERDLELVGGNGYMSALWSDGSTLWAADYYGGVLAYRLSDGARVPQKDLDGKGLSAAGNDNPGGLWSDGTTLWVADYNDGWVYAYLLSDGSRTGDEEFSVRTRQHHAMSPFGLWFADGTVLASYWARGLVKAYRESDGSHLESRDIDTGSSGNGFPRGLWSDGSTLWVADEVDLKLYAYAVADSVAASQVSVDPGPFGPIPPSWAPAVPSASPGPSVFVPDAGLRSRLEAALGKAPGESIGTREMAAIETLNLDGAAPDLWALIGLTGLKRLSLRGNGLEDLSALSPLAGLRVLDIGENRIVDLGPLAALAGLESLRADRNRIRDLAPLAALTSLRHLSLADNAVTDPLPGE